MCIMSIILLTGQELSESNNEKELRGRTLSALDCSLLLQGHEFDVFLSFASPDKDFAEEMRLRLVHRYVHVRRLSMKTYRSYM